MITVNGSNRGRQLFCVRMWTLRLCLPKSPSVRLATEWVRVGHPLAVMGAPTSGRDQGARAESAGHSGQCTRQAHAGGELGVPGGAALVAMMEPAEDRQRDDRRSAFKGGALLWSRV